MDTVFLLSYLFAFILRLTFLILWRLVNWESLLHANIFAKKRHMQNYRKLLQFIWQIIGYHYTSDFIFFFFIMHCCYDFVFDFLVICNLCGFMSELSAHLENWFRLSDSETDKKCGWSVEIGRRCDRRSRKIHLYCYIYATFQSLINQLK